eukprot:m.79144 g.79144  ORF g.79144 m.79144 type:complete len:284 (+) comp25184_c0_seq1:255-1106(+)
MINNTVIVFQGDNGGPTFDGHSNTPLRGGKLNFFEGGIRPASFVYSPLLPMSVRGQWYNGSVHETDWAPTFFSLAQLAIPTQVTGVSLWPTLLDLNHPHRTEVLIADNILRMGPWKLAAGAGNESWIDAMLKDCMLATNGGWLEPPNDPKNNSNICPLDVYTRTPKTPQGGKEEVQCNFSNSGAITLHDQMDNWLCSNPCTLDHPCLWNVESDPSERAEVSHQNSEIVSQMLARLKVLSQQFEDNPPIIGSNDLFCSHVQQRGGFLGPWMDQTLDEVWTADGV